MKVIKQFDKKIEKRQEWKIKVKLKSPGPQVRVGS